MGCSWDKAVSVFEGNKDDKCQYRKSSGPKLTEKQIYILKNTWQLLKQEIANVGVNTFVSLFEKQPELIETFNKFQGQNLDEIHDNGRLKSHALRVMATIDKCIVNIDELRLVGEILEEMGKMHKKYHVSTSIMKTILPHFLDAMKPHLEEYWCVELKEAWEALFTVMEYHIDIVMDHTAQESSTCQNKNT